jgi:proteasome lid subunit RPN8/RPN11
MRLNCEESWVLVGFHRNAIWFGEPMRYRRGAISSVSFDAAWVLAREEKKRDVIGFLHTHPMGGLAPSTRDVRTMRAWCDAFGKPLVCVIRTPTSADAWRFDDFESDGVRLDSLELFARNAVIGVDKYGWKVSSRTDLPRGGGDGEARQRADRAVRRRRARVEPCR